MSKIKALLKKWLGLERSWAEIHVGLFDGYHNVIAVRVSDKHRFYPIDNFPHGDDFVFQYHNWNPDDVFYRIKHMYDDVSVVYHEKITIQVVHTNFETVEIFSKVEIKYLERHAILNNGIAPFLYKLTHSEYLKILPAILSDFKLKPYFNDLEQSDDCEPDYKEGRWYKGFTERGFIVFKFKEIRFGWIYTYASYHDKGGSVFKNSDRPLTSYKLVDVSEIHPSKILCPNKKYLMISGEDIMVIQNGSMWEPVSEKEEAILIS